MDVCSSTAPAGPAHAGCPALVTLLPAARATRPLAPPPRPRAGVGLLSVLAMLLVVGVALVGLARALGRLRARSARLIDAHKRRAQAARAQAAPQTESERLAAEAAKARASALTLT